MDSSSTSSNKEATSVNTKFVRKIARWGKNGSVHFRSWAWFAKKTFESSVNFGSFSNDKILFSKEVLEGKDNEDSFPMHVKKSGYKAEKIRKFKKLQLYFWDICFHSDLPFKIVTDSSYGEHGFKVVASHNYVSANDIKEKLLGFVEPLRKLFPDNYTKLKGEEKETMEETFQNQYCSVITLLDQNVYALYGPLAYVNHDCNSKNVYVESEIQDTIYRCNRVIIILDNENEEEGPTDWLFYEENEEITLRYVLDTAIDSSLPFSGPCKCSSCSKKTLS